MIELMIVAAILGIIIVPIIAGTLVTRDQVFRHQQQIAVEGENARVFAHFVDLFTGATTVAAVTPDLVQLSGPDGMRQVRRLDPRRLVFSDRSGERTVQIPPGGVEVGPFVRFDAKTVIASRSSLGGATLPLVWRCGS